MIVYMVTNKVNGYVYIGKTRYTLDKRKKEHIKRSRLGSKLLFHQAIKQYGDENFVWNILCKAQSNDELSKLEKIYIAQYKKIVSLYNMTAGGDGVSGYQYIISDETRKKLSMSHKGKKLSKKQKKKISESLKGHQHSLESRKKMSLSHKGKKHSVKTKKKLSLICTGIHNPYYGKKHSRETRRKLSVSHIGQKAWNKGIPMSVKAKMKLKKSLRNLYAQRRAS